MNGEERDRKQLQALAKLEGRWEQAFRDSIFFGDGFRLGKSESSNLRDAGGKTTGA